jgi:predicted metal-dependent enzyme (double-stranded beta helix superfamily)
MAQQRHEASVLTTLGDLTAVRRQQAVARAVAHVRAIEASTGVTRSALNDIAGVLAELANDAGLFNQALFPNPPVGESARLYVLSEDDNGRFPLYLTCCNPGGVVPPHNHTTWAVVVGLAGLEQNTLWRRTDAGFGAGSASVEVRERVTVGPGEHLGLMPEDIHSVATPGDLPRRHFHMYGLALERLDARLVYDVEAGTAAIMETNTKIVRA